MKLNPVTVTHKGKNWCGIVALSTITGNPTEHSRLVLKQAIDEVGKRGDKRQVLKGVYISEMLAALSYMCIDTRKIQVPILNSIGIMSLARFLHCMKPQEGKLFLIIILEHFLVTDGISIMDSSNLNGCPIWQYRRLDENVISVHECTEFETNDL